MLKERLCNFQLCLTDSYSFFNSSLFIFMMKCSYRAFKGDEIPNCDPNYVL